MYPITKVHQMIRDGALLAVRREGVLRMYRPNSSPDAT